MFMFNAHFKNIYNFLGLPLKNLGTDLLSKFIQGLLSNSILLNGPSADKIIQKLGLTSLLCQNDEILFRYANHVIIFRNRLNAAGEVVSTHQPPFIRVNIKCFWNKSDSIFMHYLIFRTCSQTPAEWRSSVNKLSKISGRRFITTKQTIAIIPVGYNDKKNFGFCPTSAAPSPLK